MAFLLVSPAQEAWQGCVYWLYSPGLVRHVTQPYQRVQRSTKMAWETHRNIEKLSEISTPLLTARPALQKSQKHNRNDAVSLPGRNWPVLRSPFVAYYFLISRPHALLGHASLAHYRHYRVLFSILYSVCVGNAELHVNLEQLSTCKPAKICLLPKTSERSPHRCHISCFVHRGCGPSSLGAKLFIK